MDQSHDLAILRDLVARELATINHYRDLEARAPDGSARDFFLHIIEEEKLHVAEVMKAITDLDVEQARLVGLGYAEGHEPGEIPTTGESDEPSDRRNEPSETSIPAGAQRRSEARHTGLTVGTLRGIPQESAN